MILSEESLRQGMCLAICMFMLSLSACASDSGGENGAGSYIAKLVFPPEIPQAASGGASPADSSDIDCAAAGIATISCTLFSADNTIIAEDHWECSSGRGIVDNVPAGEHITVVVTAEDAGGMVMLRGEDRDVTVEANLRTMGDDIVLQRADSPMVIAGNEPKTLVFDWGHIRFPGGVDHYQLQVDPDGDSGFAAVSGAENIQGTEYALTVPVHFTDWVNALYRVVALDAVGNVVTVSANVDLLSTVSSEAVIGYFKASNTDAGDAFGGAVALSADGTTLAVGALNEESDGEETDNSMAESGAVYVFTRSNSTWLQQAYIKAGNADTGDHFGGDVALSANGGTLAIGALDEDSSGEETDNSLESSGAVYVFTRSGDAWRQQSYIKAGNADAGDQFGVAVALSFDGGILAVGARDEDSGGQENDNSMEKSGAVYVFARSGNYWHQQDYLKAGNADAGDYFGRSVALSADGGTLAVGATFEDSGGEETDNSLENSGAAYVFTQSGDAWHQQAYVKAGNADGGDIFGFAVALSADGAILTVGAAGEDSGGEETDNSLENSGAAYVFTRSGNSWNQQAYIKAGNANTGDNFGGSVALSADGAILTVGAAGEDSSGEGTDNSLESSGATYVFTRTGNTWQQQAYLKAVNTGMNDIFGVTVALSADGATLVVGATRESSSARGIGGEKEDNSMGDAGAVYLY